MYFNLGSINVVRPFSVATVSWFLIMGAGFGTASQAADFQTLDKVVIKPDEVIRDDLYILARDVVIEGHVMGDLCVACQNMTIKGIVDGNINGAAQSILIDGTVNGTARLAGQVIKIDQEASIERDLVVACFSLEMVLDSIVKNDSVVFSFQSLLDGNIDGDFFGGMANCELNGYVGGNVDIDVSDGNTGPTTWDEFGEKPAIDIPVVKPGFTLGPTAVVEGDVIYHSPSAANIDPSTQIVGDTKFHVVKSQQIEPGKPRSLRATAVSRLRSLLVILVVGIVFIVIAPRSSRIVPENIRQRPILSGLLGVVSIFLVGIAIGITILGIVLCSILSGLTTLNALIPFFVYGGMLLLAFLILGSFLYLFYFSISLFSTFLGQALLGVFFRSQRTARFFPLVVGAVILIGLTLIPYTSWVLYPLAALFATGAMLLRMMGGGQPPVTQSAMQPRKGS